MKIGILTFHYTTNQGSIMQAYSLYNYIKTRFPSNEVVVINLIPFSRELYELIFFSKKFPFFDLGKLLKYISHRKFITKNLNLTERSYKANLRKQIEYINKQYCDLIITGSDTVWFKSKKLQNKIPNIYFLPKGIKSKKISYAASADPLNDEKTYFKNKGNLQEIFKEYSIITVRDNATKDLLKNCNINSELVIDPTLLYPFEEQLGLKINNSQNKQIRRIGIGIADKLLTQKVITSLNKEGTFEIVNLFENRTLRTDFLIDELNEYSNFDAFITDRFHRTIFSLKLCKSLTIYIENAKFNTKHNSKGRDLLARMNLENKILRSDNINFENRIIEMIANWSVDEQNEQIEKVNNFIRINRIFVDNLMSGMLK